MTVDYDRIAATYNRRFDQGEQPGIEAALHALAAEVGAARILEVGCGTGHWLERLRHHTPHLFGLDLSTGMLAQARACPVPLRLSQGHASRLPFAAGVFDLVCCVNAIHHFGDQAGFVREARRVLRPGGALAVVGFQPRACRESWYVYTYFESTYETDLRRFPAWGALLDWMEAAGFARVVWQPVGRTTDRIVGRAVFDDPFIQPAQASQLALLSEEAYRAGLRQIEAALEEDEHTVFATDMLVSIIAGHVEEKGS